MMMTPTRSRGESPTAVACVMYAPSPSAANVVLWYRTTSATIEAFHAPPAAVMPPVT